MIPGGRPLSPSWSPWRLLEGHALLPRLPERWRASGVARLLPAEGLSTTLLLTTSWLGSPTLTLPLPKDPRLAS